MVNFPLHNSICLLHLHSKTQNNKTPIASHVNQYKYSIYIQSRHMWLILEHVQENEYFSCFSFSGRALGMHNNVGFAICGSARQIWTESTVGFWHMHVRTFTVSLMPPIYATVYRRGFFMQKRDCFLIRVREKVYFFRSSNSGRALVIYILY